MTRFEIVLMWIARISLLILVGFFLIVFLLPAKGEPYSLPISAEWSGRIFFILLFLATNIPWFIGARRFWGKLFKD